MEKFYVAPKAMLSKAIELSNGTTLPANTEVALIYRTEAGAVQVDSDNTLADILTVLNVGSTESFDPQTTFKNALNGR